MSPPVDVRLTIGHARYEDGPRLPVFDPWSGEEIARVVMADAKRAEEAAVASVRAFDRMRALKAYERRDLLRRVADGIRGRAGEIAELIAREAGKPIAQARAR